MSLPGRCLRAGSALSLLLISACGDGVTDVSNNDFSASEPFRFEFGREDRSRFVLDGISGDITLEATSPDSIIIQGERRVESDSQSDALARLANLRVEVAETDNEIRVRTEQPSNSRGRNYVVDYSVALPADFVVDIDAVNGEVSVGSLRSPVLVSSVNGIVSAEDIEASTVGLTLVNGLIEASITLPTGGAAALSTVNGNIGLSVPAETSAEIDATVVNGTISLSGLPLGSLTITPRSVRGRLGGGDGSIALSTVNGNIVLRGF